MKGKSWSVSIGMIFKKYYCFKCGAKLHKEKNHRVVSPGDVDYFQYQDRATYPRISHDVYDYHFKCPSCNSRYSYEHQCIVSIIQKDKRKIILNNKEYREKFLAAKNIVFKRRTIFNIIALYIFMILSCSLAYVLSKFDSTIIILSVIVLIIMTIINIWRYKHPKKRIKRTISNKDLDYSHDEEFLVNYLYSFSYNNKEDIYESNHCYCFYCNKKIESKDITKYDDNINALCPICNNKTIISENIDEVNEETIDLMNKYWF